MLLRLRMHGTIPKTVAVRIRTLQPDTTARPVWIARQYQVSGPALENYAECECPIKSSQRQAHSCRRLQKPLLLHHSEQPRQRGATVPVQRVVLAATGLYRICTNQPTNQPTSRL